MPNYIILHANQIILNARSRKQTKELSKKYVSTRSFRGSGYDYFFNNLLTILEIHLIVHPLLTGSPVRRRQAVCLHRPQPGHHRRLAPASLAQGPRDAPRGRGLLGGGGGPLRAAPEGGPGRADPAGERHGE